MAEVKLQPERWSLKELFPSPEGPELEQASRELDLMLSEFEGCRETLGPTLNADEFVQIVGQYERALRKISRFVNYGALLFYEDTQNQKAQSLFAQGRQSAAEF